MKYEPDNIYLDDTRDLEEHIDLDTVSLSVWSPPYLVGKAYERDMSFFGGEQTVDRGTRGNNIRGGKYETQTRVKLVGGMLDLEQYALDCGLYLYDRRAWIKDAARENSRCHT